MVIENVSVNSLIKIIEEGDIEEITILESHKSFSVLLFIILILFWLFPAIIYLIYYATKEEDTFTIKIIYNDGNERLYKNKTGGSYYIKQLSGLIYSYQNGGKKVIKSKGDLAKIKEAAELLKDGIITQEEFDRIKKDNL